MNKIKNKWRLAFLILAGIVLGFVLFIGFLTVTPREKNLPSKTETTVVKGSPVMTMTTNKKKLNTIIDYFLEDFQKNSEVKYEFYLENQALLKGKFKLLGADMDFYLYFDPYVMDNGDIQLKAKDLSVGSLNLPIKEALNMLKRSYKFPKWVEVSVEDQNVILKVTQLKLTSGLFVKASRIDLPGDDIQLNLYLPNKAEEKN